MFKIVAIGVLAGWILLPAVSWAEPTPLSYTSILQAEIDHDEYRSLSIRICDNIRLPQGRDQYDRMMGDYRGILPPFEAVLTDFEGKQTLHSVKHYYAMERQDRSRWVTFQFVTFEPRTGDESEYTLNLSWTPSGKRKVEFERTSVVIRHTMDQAANLEWLNQSLVQKERQSGVEHVGVVHVESVPFITKKVRFDWFPGDSSRVFIEGKDRWRTKDPTALVLEGENRIDIAGYQRLREHFLQQEGLRVLTETDRRELPIDLQSKLWVFAATQRRVHMNENQWVLESYDRNLVPQFKMHWPGGFAGGINQTGGVQSQIEALSGNDGVENYIIRTSLDESFLRHGYPQDQIDRDRNLQWITQSPRLRDTVRFALYDAAGNPVERSCAAAILASVQPPES